MKPIQMPVECCDLNLDELTAGTDPRDFLRREKLQNRRRFHRTDKALDRIRPAFICGNLRLNRAKKNAGC